MAFTGFPTAALDFYEDLEADNSKAFWTVHKSVWEESVRDPMAELMAELAPEFGEGQLFRPYRDVRFSKDKSPYKTHQGAFVPLADGMGYYLQLSAEGLFVAGGYHSHAPDQVDRFRQAVADEVSGPELSAVVGQLEKSGWRIDGDALKTRPRGFPADHPRMDLLRHKSLTAGRSFGSPAWLATKSARARIAKSWRGLRDLNDWLIKHVGPTRLPRDRR